MKTLKYFGLILCSTTLWVACSNEETGRENVTKVPLEIQIGSVDTRTIIEGTTLPMESTFGIVGTTDDATIMSNINNLSVAYDGKCHLEKEVLLDKTSFHIRAYYPYKDDFENGDVFWHVRDQVDFLFGSGVDASGNVQEINNQNPKANIVFKHALSRITFKVKHTEQIAEDFNLTKIILLPVYETAMLYPIPQTIKPNALTEVSFDIDFTVGKEFTTFDLLMLPTEANSDRGIYLYDSLDKNIWVKLPEGDWKSGQQYTYELIYDDNRITISEAVITPWNYTMQEESEITEDNLATD